MSATSTTDAEQVVLRDGSSVVIRPLADGDEAAIASWFAALGDDTRYARFFALLERLDHRSQTELARIDHVDREAVTAVAPDGATVGIARYVRVAESAAAEVAVAVADEWSGKGIATMLLVRVAERARLAGIRQFVALCLATNAPVIRLLRRLGRTVVDPPVAGIVELRIDLTSSGPARLSTPNQERCV